VIHICPCGNYPVNKTTPISNANSKFKPYTIADTIAKKNPIPVQKFGDKPVDAKLVPIFSRWGCNEFLMLFNTSFH